MKYTVMFTKYYEYEVDAESRNEAKKEAIRCFENDMYSPITDTSYDDIEVEEDEND